MRNRTKALSGISLCLVYTEKLAVIPFQGRESEAFLWQIKARVR